MKIQRAVLALAFSAASLGVYAQQPDHTKVNERDRATNEPTADQQKNNRTDLDLTKNIRKSIMDDKSLSTYAHNVKVISQNGTVTLKGKLLRRLRPDLAMGLGMAYLPVELPTGDYYGGHRPGNGLFGESLVAVDLQTGKRKWHYQLIHQ